jgi:hypothetical protein
MLPITRCRKPLHHFQPVLEGRSAWALQGISFVRLSLADDSRQDLSRVAAVMLLT